MNILVISLAGIGDTILATPLIHELRANYPEARIEALVMWPGSKDILQGNPHLNAVHQHNLIKAGSVEGLKLLKPLRESHYDVSINTHPQSRIHYRFTAWIVGARLRLSHLYDCSGLIDRFLVNRTMPQDYQKHSVDNNLELLSLLGKKPVLPEHRLELFLTPAEHHWAESFLASAQVTHRRRLGIHIGSGSTKNLALKRWPLEHFMDLIRRTRATWPDLAILLFGGPEEEPELEKIVGQHAPGAVVRVRSQNLRQAAAVIQRCAAFLSVDTALMHVAAAVKAPGQLVIEAPTFNRTNPPYGNPFVLIPNPAVGGHNLEYYRFDGRGIQGTPEELLRCMASVSVESVFQALAKVLGAIR